MWWCHRVYWTRHQVQLSIEIMWRILDSCKIPKKVQSVSIVHVLSKVKKNAANVLPVWLCASDGDRGHSLNAETMRQKEEMGLGTRLGNKVLDTFLYNSISCLRHANNQIGALKFESGSIPSDKNITQNTRPALLSMTRPSWRLQWDYFGSTPWLIALYMIQLICKSSFLWKWSRVQHSC